MKATVTHVSQSTNSVIISINKAIPGTKLISKISGFIACEQGSYQKGDVIDLPSNVVVKKEQRSNVDEDGVVRTFDWLTFE